MELYYSKEQLKRAAKFVFEHNYYLQTANVKEVKTLIKQTLFKFAKDVKRKLRKNEDWTFVSTAGFTILIFLEEYPDGSKVLEADITVDPAVGDTETRRTVRKI